METQIWVKSEEKWAYLLVLRGDEVSQLKVTGNMLTLKKNVAGVVEALEQGKAPAEVGAKSVETLDARKISKAEVSPGNMSLTLHSEDSSASSLSFSSADSNADQILAAILARSGRTFLQKQEEIGVVEALIPPAFIGIVGGLGWFAVYMSASDIAAGKQIEVKGVRSRGLQRILITIADTLGPNGTIGLGVVLLLLVIVWAARRVIRRPLRTVWLPEQTGG
jgi:hypothetical protein